MEERLQCRGCEKDFRHSKVGHPAGGKRIAVAGEHDDADAFSSAVAPHYLQE